MYALVFVGIFLLSKNLSTPKRIPNKHAQQQHPQKGALAVFVTRSHCKTSACRSNHSPISRSKKKILEDWQVLADAALRHFEGQETRGPTENKTWKQTSSGRGGPPPRWKGKGKGKTSARCCVASGVVETLLLARCPRCSYMKVSITYIYIYIHVVSCVFFQCVLGAAPEKTDSLLLPLLPKAQLSAQAESMSAQAGGGLITLKAPSTVFYRFSTCFYCAWRLKSQKALNIL